MMQHEFDRIIAQLRNQEISRAQAEHLLQELKARQRSTLPTPPKGVGTDNLSAAKPDQIAIIGMSGQFPGAADIGAFWQNLVSGHDGIGELPPHYWPEQLRQDAQSHYRWGGVVAERACFDPLFFNISPREAEAMHPHQRLILQESWKALEDAGYNPKSLAETQVGLYIGAEPIGYFHDSFTGSSEAIIASRLSYHLNLKGPALVVNTGCSSSGVAIHLACESLRHGETCMALAGGVFAMLAQDMLDALADIGMLSASHRCKSFDAAADGTAFSEGVGVVVLKRLEDAQADGDPIYALIVGSGINQDGTSNGITAPNGTAQEALITDVYRRYRINPEQISYVEAHGTGTKLGDPVEANALARAFRQFTDKQGYCRVGSAKAHIGHTSASAGVIGLIKVLLSLQHHKIPGLLHFEQLNPLIDWQASAFYLTTQTLPWQASDGAPLLAALNSFGHSGTNVHLVVSEYQTTELPSLPDLSQPVLIPLSANTQDSLLAYSAKLARFLVERTVRLADLAYTLQIARDAMPERVMFLVQTSAELVAGLQAFSSGQTLGLPYWQGQVADTSALSEDDKAVLADLSTPARLAKMAVLWVQGVAVDWHKLYGADRPRRIHIPTYAFAKEHYWAQAKTPKLSVAPYSHPLVQENTSDFAGQCYSSTLTGQEFFLAGHQLHGKPVLPGVAYLEMAVAAVKRATARYGHTDGLIRLKNVVWVRPLEVCGVAVTVHIGLVPEDDGQVQFEIYTQADANATNVHSQGMAEALAPPAPRYLDLPQLQAQIQRAYPHPEQGYQHFRSAGVVHSADFKCLQPIYT
ncbi:MAG: type I polyketide synthase, partial [Methylovulum sp.]|nr:type I polyketide synthase [Methylovulum sp.]